MQLIIPVAVKPYLKKYLERSLIDAGHPDPLNPFVLNTDTKFGIFLYQCLEKPGPKLVWTNKGMRHSDLNADYEIDKTVYSATLKVMVSEHFWGKIGCIITPQKQLHFNKFVYLDFQEEFYRYVKNRIGKKGSINKAIVTFCAHYSIYEDDLSFRTIQRSFQRRNTVANHSFSA